MFACVYCSRSVQMFSSIRPNVQQPAWQPVPEYLSLRRDATSPPHTTGDINKHRGTYSQG